jgi:hypothetical protein
MNSQANAFTLDADRPVPSANPSLGQTVLNQYQQSAENVFSLVISPSVANTWRNGSLAISALPGFSALIDYFPGVEITRVEFVLDPLANDVLVYGAVTANTSCGKEFADAMQCVSHCTMRSTTINPSCSVAALELHAGIAKIIHPFPVDGRIPQLIYGIKATQVSDGMLTIKVYWKSYGPMIVKHVL